MNTKKMSQFEIMDTEMLACVEGGGAIGEILPKQVLEEEQYEVFS
ncbi:bacteriocin BlpO [Streptococcus pneumoniae]|nr:bacteriocin BlpO [Streptococcus pneumoniae]VKT13636.1 bacteriocin BlpO [Streptococcus pneumoniae]VKZ51420.1 bacteriocin BlpO [Streptococcus pneumoniae]VLE69768.1 bacteriocin BlpO [Streptococcus pneumoniae]VLH41029.1 bacteriocin BlpO [Streptococcus pneumoniae]